MKAKMKPHKLLSMLLALVMVVGMLPAMGQVAYAYSAGDIAGTTGSGASEADTSSVFIKSVRMESLFTYEITHCSLNNGR